AGHRNEQCDTVSVPVTATLAISVFQLSGDDAHFGLRLRMGNPLFQARNHGQETANLLMIVKRLREDKRRPYARLCAGERAVFDEPVEILRRDANNGLRLSIEKNGFTDNRW